MDDPDTPRADTAARPAAARVAATACPVCGKTTAPRYRPFCSRRCADVDLSRWLGGGYVVPGHDTADPEEIAAALAEAPPGRDSPDGA